MLREPVGDGGHEAYTTIVWGGLLSRESGNIAGAEDVGRAEGNMDGTVMQGVATLPWSKTPSRAKGSRWNLGGLVSGWAATAALVRVGKARSRSRR